jgi:hypothetical protein
MTTLSDIQLIPIKNGYDNGGRVIFASRSYTRDIYFKDFSLVEAPLRELGLCGPIPASFDGLKDLASFANLDLDHFNDVMDRYQNDGVPAPIVEEE